MGLYDIEMGAGMALDRGIGKRLLVDLRNYGFRGELEENMEEYQTLVDRQPYTFLNNLPKSMLAALRDDEAILRSLLTSTPGPGAGTTDVAKWTTELVDRVHKEFKGGQGMSKNEIKWKKIDLELENQTMRKFLDDDLINIAELTFGRMLRTSNNQADDKYFEQSGFLTRETDDKYGAAAVRLNQLKAEHDFMMGFGRNRDFTKHLSPMQRNYFAKLTKELARRQDLNRMALVKQELQQMHIGRNAMDRMLPPEGRQVAVLMSKPSLEYMKKRTDHGEVRGCFQADLSLSYT